MYLSNNIINIDVDSSYLYVDLSFLWNFLAYVNTSNLQVKRERSHSNKWRQNLYIHAYT